MKTIKILSSHATLAEAVQVSGYDVSYNPAEYASQIKSTDVGSPRHNLSGTIKAFIVEGHEYGNPIILYVVSAEGVNFIHRFSLSGCLSDGDITLNIVDEESKFITVTDVSYPKSPNGRKSAAAICAASVALVAFS